ncbi:ABC transporter substrate-binding protein [Clostridium gasigenes]|uniref:ABC transporter substrate-binding protein n=1 Tax=Clostridium gasigenes TaxID=94869 RepID=UPI001C0C1DF2|nr:spermidine/putrescine ABC transporter substrate-binding protein [Clostridium gasigenes]MBU3107632.1 spermidine/putrescine ABC transporter substrate-binding protein [Clostridium gasigenes]
MKKLKTLGAILLATAISTSLFVGCGKDSGIGENGTIHVFNVGDYINLDLIEKFELETKIDIVYDVYDTNETMYQRVSTNPGQYDIVVPSDYMVERMIKNNMLDVLDYSNIPNIEHIDDKFRNLAYDPENKYTVPYMWGTVGIIYDADIVTEPVTSWDILWDEKYDNKNILMFDSMRDTLAVSLKRLGYSLNTVNPNEIKAAQEDLIKQKEKVDPLYAGDDVKDKMINGEASIATVWSGDAQYIISESYLNLKYVVPKEGSNKWFDSMVIPKDAPNKSGAEAFINFLCNPENAAENVNYIGYSTPNKGAFDLLDEEVKNNESAYPSDATLDNCEIFIDLGDNLKLYDESWTIVTSK